MWIYSGSLARPSPVPLAGENPLNHSLLYLVIAGGLQGGGPKASEAGQSRWCKSAGEALGRRSRAEI